MRVDNDFWEECKVGWIFDVDALPEYVSDGPFLENSIFEGILLTCQEVDVDHLALNVFDLLLIKENGRVVGFVDFSNNDYFLGWELDFFQSIFVAGYPAIVDEIHSFKRTPCHFLEPFLDLSDRGRVRQTQIKPIFLLPLSLHNYRHHTV